MSNFKSSLINDLATARLGQPGGFAKLDENGLVTPDQLPSSITSGWVEATRPTNPMNPFASIPAKLDGNGNPYVWRFSSNGPVSLDGTTVISVTTQDRIWYHISSDTWFHEKQPPTFSGSSLANAGYPGLVPLAQQNEGFRSLHGNGQFLFPHQFANTYPAPYINVIYVGQGLLAKQDEIYELNAEAGDRNGIRIVPDTDWSDVDPIYAQPFSGNPWTVVDQPTSGKQECFVVPNYNTLEWQFKTTTMGGSSTVAEYGEQVLGSNITVPTTSTSPTVATDILLFTLPSAGTWDVDFIVRGATFAVNTSGGSGMVAVLTDNSNNVIANTELKVGRESFASVDALTFDLQFSATGKAQIVTTGATTYKVRGYHDGSGGSTGSWTAQSDNNGRTKVFWNKIAGQLPVIIPTTFSGGLAFGNGTALVQDSTNLFYDDVSNRLGVGTNTPTTPLHIKGKGAPDWQTAVIERIQDGVGDRTVSLRLINGNTTQSPWHLGVGGIGNNIGASDGDFYIYDETNNAVKYFIDRSTGNHGINKVTPLNTLEIGNAAVVNTGGIRLPITSASPDQTGSAIGVNADGDIVKIAASNVKAIMRRSLTPNVATTIYSGGSEQSFNYDLVQIDTLSFSNVSSFTANRSMLVEVKITVNVSSGTGDFAIKTILRLNSSLYSEVVGTVKANTNIGSSFLTDIVSLNSGDSVSPAFLGIGFFDPVPIISSYWSVVEIG